MSESSLSAGVAGGAVIGAAVIAFAFAILVLWRAPSARRAAIIGGVFASIAVLPVWFAVVGARSDDVDLLWMLAPHDQARVVAAARDAVWRGLGDGAVFAAALCAAFAAATTRSLWRDAVDRSLGTGVVGAIALGAPVVVVASTFVGGVIAAPGTAITVVAIAAGVAGVLVAASTVAAFARVSPTGAAARLVVVTALACGVVGFASIGAIVVLGADDRGAVAAAAGLGTVVLVLAAGLGLWRARDAGRITGARHQPTPAMTRDLPDADMELPAALAVVVVVVCAAVGAVVVRGGLVPLPQLARFSAVPAVQTEALWPDGVEPRAVTTGVGRCADVVVFADGSFGPLPTDDDVPAILVDTRADPRPLLRALRAAGFAEALLVGPSGHGDLGGVVVATTDEALAR